MVEDGKPQHLTKHKNMNDNPEIITVAIPSHIIALMRDWLAECVWADMDAEDFSSIPDAMVIRGVRRFYCGGLNSFFHSL